MQDVHVQTLLPADVHKELKFVAIRDGTTVKQLIKRAILHFLTHKTLKEENNGKSKETN